MLHCTVCEIYVIFTCCSFGSQKVGSVWRNRAHCCRNMFYLTSSDMLRRNLLHLQFIGPPNLTQINTDYIPRIILIPPYLRTVRYRSIMLTIYAAMSIIRTPTNTLPPLRRCSSKLRFCSAPSPHGYLSRWTVQRSSWCSSLRGVRPHLILPAITGCYYLLYGGRRPAPEHRAQEHCNPEI